MIQRITPLLIVFALVAAACGDDDSTGGTTATTAAATTTTSATTTSTPAAATTAPDTTTTVAATTTTAPATTTSTEPPAAAESDFRISEVGFGDTGYVAITNLGAAGSLGGHWLCQRPSYFELPDVEVGAGETVIVAVGDNPALMNVIATTGSVGRFDAASGEVGLYTSRSFGSADAIISYVEWGNSGHGRSGTAVEAGIWPDGDFVASAGAALMSYDETLGAGSAAWVIAVP